LDCSQTCLTCLIFWINVIVMLQNLINFDLGIIYLFWIYQDSIRAMHLHSYLCYCIYVNNMVMCCHNITLINSSRTFYIRFTSIYYIGIMMLLVLKASPFLFSIEQYFVISLSQAGMHIYSRASAAGKRVQVSLYLCWLSVKTILIFYLVVSSMIHSICFCFFIVQYGSKESCNYPSWCW
jgi:hypothetical protein